MPDFGTSNRVALRQVAESTWGTTPSSPSLDAIRFTSESLNYNADFITSEEIRADRMTPDTIQVAASAGGDINGEWSYGSYDDLIEGAMYSDWLTTGSAQGADTTIAIVKTGGSPNTWTLTDSGNGLASNSWVVGQFVKVTGFSTAGTFYAEITSIAAGTLGIYPLTDVASETAGDSVTITPMNFIRNGTTKKSFTIQKEFEDLATPEFLNLTGARMASWSLELATGSILNTSFSVLAKDAAMTESQFGSATENAAGTTSVLNAVDNIASIAFDGDPGATTFYFNSLAIELDNNLRGQEAVGTLGFVGVEAGRLSLTGSIELYFENSSLFDKFKAATTFSISFLAQDVAGNVYIVNIPRAKYTEMEIVAGGLDQDIFVSASFEGIINSAGTYQYQISRLAA